jgi:hypothetical protein
MVAKIKSGKRLKGALNYNENKVKSGKAELIHAEGYFKELLDLTFYDKLLRLEDLARRNDGTKTNTVHISLNFANGETLPTELLQNITNDYMQGIGFENQPYLVYRHSDAGHPHIHIVTTNIKASGERISLHYLGQNQSEKARKAIEIKYRLVKAEAQQQKKPGKAVQADYGKAETKRQITNIVNQTIREYKFTSIPELNAILQQYNITADPGAKDSRMHQKKGLLYWVTDRKGGKQGVPIKASSIYGKPTLKVLQERFLLNEALRKPLKPALIKTIDQALTRPTKAAFEQALEKQNIRVIFRQNDEGRIYGITFIDHQNKAVFNGSDLGKAYSANLLTARFQTERTLTPTTKEQAAPQQLDSYDAPSGNVLDILLQPEHEDQAALAKFKKKRRKRQHL